MFLKVISILSVQYFIVQCIIPGLKVNRMDKNLIKKQRQDTLDMCRMFSENKPLSSNHQPNSLPKTPYHFKDQRSRRGKRSVQYESPPSKIPEAEDAKRIENIVDKLYDDMQENGVRVEYRKRDLGSMMNTEVPKNYSGRRFHFAPKILLGPADDEVKQRVPVTLNSIKTKTVEIPWHKKWINGIVPFFIDPNTYDSQLADKITKAFAYFGRATCIRLQRLKDRPTDKKSLKEVEWLYITNPLGIKQCVHSNAVKVNKGVQMVVFGYDCLSLGEVVHEVMHILGFSHEHTRPDRDQHITVLWNNIKPGYKNYFEVKELGTLTHLPYDYSSILHYPSRAFSRNGQFTLLADKANGARLGQRKGLSELDVEKVTTIYGNECVNRNRKYLLQTCSSVVKPTEAKRAPTKPEIEDYFKDRLWQYGVVTYKIRDSVEFSAEEMENIQAVFRHIEKETCIQFNDVAKESDEVTEEPNVEQPESKQGSEMDVTDRSQRGDAVPDSETDLGKQEFLRDARNKTQLKTRAPSENEISQNANEDTPNPPKSLRKAGVPVRFSKRSRRRSALRRHAGSILTITRSPEPGCKCPPPGKPEGDQELKINADCFNSVNDLLHLFVHVLGLDHQHNMHDRDDYLKIVWENLTPDVKEELENTLPPAASVGFPYDYLSVMHYPWLQIKDGVANIMYPVWNDGWAMGHWQGLSSTDVQKLNLLYFQQCLLRKKLNN